MLRTPHRLAGPDFAVVAGQLERLQDPLQEALQATGQILNLMPLDFLG